MIDYTKASEPELKEEFKRLAKLTGDVPFGTKKEFFHLPKILNKGETPLAIAKGMMDGNTWLITLTNERVIFLDKGMLYGVKQIDVNLKDIVSVAGKTGIIQGDIMVSTAGQNYTIKSVAKASVIPFTYLVNSTRNKKTATNNHVVSVDHNDVISQFERLASLREKGILSNDEFHQQKQRILNG